MIRSKYHAETIEQFRIMRWIRENFCDEGITEIQRIDRGRVRICDRDGSVALLTYRSDGTVDVQALVQETSEQ